MVGFSWLRGVPIVVGVVCLLADGALAATLISNERAVRLYQAWERNGYTCVFDNLNACEVPFSSGSTVQDDEAEGTEDFAGFLDAEVGQVTQTSSLDSDQLSASGTLRLTATERGVCYWSEGACGQTYAFISDFYSGTARNSIDVVFGVPASGQIDLTGTVDATSACCDIIFMYPDLSVSVSLGPIDGPPLYQRDETDGMPIDLTASIPVSPGTYRLRLEIDAGVDWVWFASDNFTPVNVDVAYDLDASLPGAREVPVLAPAARAVLVGACSLASICSLRHSRRSGVVRSR